VPCKGPRKKNNDHDVDNEVDGDDVHDDDNDITIYLLSICCYHQISIYTYTTYKK
jgi:hypothetical protein